MNLGPIINAVSLAWLVSEIVLSRVKHSDAKKSKLDAYSLRILWTTIALSVSSGVFLGLRRIGFIATGSYFISVSGLSLIVIGLIVRWIAILTLRKYFTVDVSIVSDHRIVTHGLYRWVRHPSYAGSLLSFLGLGICFSCWVSTLVVFLPILVAFIYRIRVEEKVLAAYLGDEYGQYSASTKRLIPGVY
ncbi:MAG: isoprenylcysteine carboxylmethyltransferase family protein [Bacteroidota bacterium]|jgi:protein-S-isoprenylcysteine O-methyltransferase Ste14